MERFSFRHEKKSKMAPQIDIVSAKSNTQCAPRYANAPELRLSIISEKAKAGCQKRKNSLKARSFSYCPLPEIAMKDKSGSAMYRNKTEPIVQTTAGQMRLNCDEQNAPQHNKTHDMAHAMTIAPRNNDSETLE